jgi:hypothetical protein
MGRQGYANSVSGRCPAAELPELKTCGRRLKPTLRAEAHATKGGNSL